MNCVYILSWILEDQYRVLKFDLTIYNLYTQTLFFLISDYNRREFLLLDECGTYGKI